FPVQILAEKCTHVRPACLQLANQRECMRTWRVAAIVLRIPGFYATGQILKAFDPLEVIILRMCDDRDRSLRFNLANYSFRIGAVNPSRRAVSENVHALVACELHSGYKEKLIVRQGIAFVEVFAKTVGVKIFCVIADTDEPAPFLEEYLVQLLQRKF